MSDDKMKRKVIKKCNISIEVLHFLTKDYSLNNAKRMTRFEAFFYLVQTYIDNQSKHEKMMITIDFLVSIFRWSRPSVAKFVAYLHEHDVVTFATHKRKKIIFIKPTMFI